MTRLCQKVAALLLGIAVAASAATGAAATQRIKDLAAVEGVRVN